VGLYWLSFKWGLRSLKYNKLSGKYDLRDSLPNTNTLLCSQICTGVLHCYCPTYRLHEDQNVETYPLWKLETRAFASTADFIHAFLLFLISFFFLYFSCMYIYSIYVFELCEMWSFHTCFYVVSHLLGCETIYAVLKLLTFLSSVTFKRGTEQCSERRQIPARWHCVGSVYLHLKMLSVTQTTLYHLHNNSEKMKETAVAGLKEVPQNWTGRTGRNQGKHQ